LDVGAGSGRDLAALAVEGFDCYGVEPSEGLRAAAIARHTELAERLADGALPALGTPFGGEFDGILCSAVLMHLQDADLFDAVLALRQILKPHGRLLLSLPSARSDVGPDERDQHGRLFRARAPEEVQLLAERMGFQLIGRWDTDDALHRTGTRWYTLLLELRSTGALRAVDRIEGILNRDRKVATYKFALFRALAEIATQESHGAIWRNNGHVAVPLERIAWRWLLYYWPIFACERFVPQSQAEGAGTNQPLAFRAPVAALMNQFAGQGEHGGSLRGTQRR
jgi:SAM-dependent methyltransferase